MTEMPDFSERVQDILRRANVEAAHLGHEYVGTEHVLLGLLREDHGVATTVLENLQVDRGALIARVDATVQRGAAGMEQGAERPLTSRTKRSLELAAEAATALGQGAVGMEHLLLGLLEERGNLAAQLLTEAGVSHKVARDEIARVMGMPPG